MELISVSFWKQMTVTRDGQQVSLRGKGRHDPCVLPRAIPMVEAMVALTLLDHLMMQQAQCELFPNEANDINPMGKNVKGLSSAGKKAHVAAAGAGAPLNQRIDEE
jgi:Chorismate synthase